MTRKLTLVLGSTGLVGSAIKRYFEEVRDENDYLFPTKTELDLENSYEVDAYMDQHRPNRVIMAAGKVGGIVENSLNQYNQFHSNYRINLNVISSSIKLNIEEFILISSSCIYPSNISSPFQESQLFCGLPEFSNEGYANAKTTAARLVLMHQKISGQNWKVIVPTNTYGQLGIHRGDSHVISQLSLKFATAMINGKDKISLLGDGSAIRQFIYSSDLARAIAIIVEKKPRNEIINIGSSESVSIRELVSLFLEVSGYQGDVSFSTSTFNGHPNKSLSSEIIYGLGWQPLVSLRDGIALCYDFAKLHIKNQKKV